MAGSRALPGLHIQRPWTDLLLSGRKTVETRTYRLPDKHAGKLLAIIETPERGIRGNASPPSRIVGLIRFSRSFRYETRNQWLKDHKRHQVSPNDKLFGWNTTKEKWGWEVDFVKKLANPIKPPKKRGIVFAASCQIPNSELEGK